MDVVFLETDETVGKAAVGETVELREAVPVGARVERASLGVAAAPLDSVMPAKRVARRALSVELSVFDAARREVVDMTVLSQDLVLLVGNEQIVTGNERQKDRKSLYFLDSAPQEKAAGKAPYLAATKMNMIGARESPYWVPFAASRLQATAKCRPVLLQSLVCVKLHFDAFTYLAPSLYSSEASVS